MGFWSFFKRGEKLKQLMERNALIIDVRTPAEFKSQSLRSSRNIPLQEFSKSIQKIKKMQRPVVLCCASGMRSAQATRMLKSEGVECVNAGSWQRLKKYVD